MFERLLMGLQGYQLNPVADLVHPQFKVVDSDSGRFAQLGGCSVRLLGLSDLRGSVRSKVCLLVASGPSMASIPLESFKNCTLFCVNGAISLFDGIGFGPTYYVCNDSDAAKDRYPLLLEGVQRAEFSFLSPAALSLLMERDPEIASISRIVMLERADQRFQSLAMKTKKYKRYLKSSSSFIYNSDISRDKAIGFSKDIDLGVCDVRTVAYMVIQIAYSMGFTRCLMGGVDMGGGRCYAEENPCPSYLEQNFEKYILPGFTLIAEQISHEEFEVYNLSAESKIPGDVIQKIPYQKALDF